ncbi:uncharacterized protein Z520_02313 [Fonsecaea multimorphosa CBS 102226]|uniref:Pru domain-containing protein n=1 Tax=Fonsecaea multimorphosa CBS 102226 TaxID=1442371 RepID=A0A0D2KFE2_9EURO|nr:uncharacterized protein Z520_02313 [Fonsecaea multimorphosa CBS 102226]KIY02175.1 hypothetical protein Z520_02313 [Fonsecaea multimorphosa CBS 102226]OAL29368.1 hypothetical protein AYO22_02262 [Fonsecaea multimorphosa]
MSVSPILTFKAGLCELDTSTSPPRAKPLPTPGYLYLYADADEILHLCWRPRSASLDEAQLDLLMVPMDGSFTPYQPTSAENPSPQKTPTNGRIYVLKFTSSSQRHLFWLQSRSQHPQGDPSWFSARDLKLGQIVNNLLQGEEVDVQEQMASLPPDENSPDDDGPEPMEDVEGTDHNPDRRPSQGGPGAGPDATGGDFREEGEESREGGADGGRAAAGRPDASALVRNFLQAMEQRNQRQAPEDKLFASLGDLLTPSSTLPILESADDKLLDRLFERLPPQLADMVQASVDTSALQNPNSTPEEQDAAKQALTKAKKTMLRKVLHSPQFAQSLASLTIALREGGLPIVSETFKIPVRNGGYLRHGGVPMGGGEAMEAFLAGIKKDVEDKMARGDEDVAGDRMDQD